MGKKLAGEMKKYEFGRGAVVFFIMMEAALFERFFIPYEIRTMYYGYISIFNTVSHLIILYPVLNYIFFSKRK